MVKTLNKLEVNERSRIVRVRGEEILKRRFLDLGFIPGEGVECVLISPFKDPKAYRIKGNIIALRNSDASNVEVLE